MADNYDNSIRKITPGGQVTTVVGVAAPYVGCALDSPLGPGTGFAAGTLPGNLANVPAIAISGTSLYIATSNGVAVVNGLP